MDLSHYLCVMLHCPSFLWGPLYMCVLHYSEGKRSMSKAGLLAVKSPHLARCHQHPLHQRHWMKLNCWTRDNWLFGGMVEVVTPLAHFKSLPHQY